MFALSEGGSIGFLINDTFQLGATRAPNRAFIEFVVHQNVDTTHGDSRQKNNEGNMSVHRPKNFLELRLNIGGRKMFQ